MTLQSIVFIQHCKIDPHRVRVVGLCCCVMSHCVTASHLSILLTDIWNDFRFSAVSRDGLQKSPVRYALKCSVPYRIYVQTYVSEELPDCWMWKCPTLQDKDKLQARVAVSKLQSPQEDRKFPFDPPLIIITIIRLCNICSSSG